MMRFFASRKGTIMLQVQASRSSARRGVGVLLCMMATALMGVAVGQPPAQQNVPPVIVPAQQAAKQNVRAPGNNANAAPAADEGDAKDDKKAGENVFVDRVKLLVDPRAKRKLDEAKRLIANQDWSQAIRLLQGLIDSKEDVFLQEEADGEGQGRRISVRAEASQLIGSLPKEGKQFYELEYGGLAKSMLRQGKVNGEPQVFADVAMRYLHTEAGLEATALLGSYHLDQGRHVVAALCYERMLERESNLSNLPALTLFKAALAFERAGEPARRDALLTAFLAKRDQPGEGPLPPALRRFDAEELRAAVRGRETDRLASIRENWPMYLGAPDRNAQGVGSAPFLVPRAGFPLPMLGKLAPPKTNETLRAWIEKTLKPPARQGQPVISGFHPLAIGDLALFRSYWGVHAVHVKSGTLAWESEVGMGLAQLALMNDPTVYISQQVDNLSEKQPRILYENSLLGTMSADHQLVYLVEDLAIPPQQVNFGGFGRNQAIGPSEYQKRIYYNRLLAFDLASQGRLAFDLGGEQPDVPFGETFFLGPPLPLGDKLYVLTEHAPTGEFRLVCLQVRRNYLGDSQSSYTVSTVWSQTLCLAEYRMLDEPSRRTQAVHLAYGNGVLVCPTNAGAILGVDLLTHRLLWAHSYQKEKTPPSAYFPNMNFQMRRNAFPQPPMYDIGDLNKPRWVVSAPVISGGYVVCTSPDGNAVHTLNLRDGTLVWRHAQPDSAGDPDVYLAGVFDQKVLVVTQRACKALSLAKGEVVWSTPLGGLPSGRGVASGGFYYLPVQNPDGRGGEVIALQIHDGKIHSRSKSYDAEVPGNLIFHAGDVISQSATKLCAYPQLAVRERDILARLSTNPRDPEGLLDRGELRLYRGELVEAADDLRTALKADLSATARRKAKDKLFDALTELLDRDFPAHEDRLKEFASLTRIDPVDGESGDTRRQRELAELDRRAKYLRLLAKGREGQKRFADALKAYRDFTQLGDQLLTNPDDPAVRILPQAWAQGRVLAMLKAAGPEPRRELEAGFVRLWDEVRTSKNPEAIREFAGFFGPLCEQGREAQLATAEWWLDQKKAAEAILQFAMVAQDPAASPSQAARALEGLARTNTRLGELENAAYYYRRLALRYPKVVVREGKTGEQIFAELATDKRFLPYLDEPRSGSLGMGLPQVRLEPISPSQPFQNQRLTYLEPEGEVPPSYRRYRLGIDTGRKVMRLIDTVRGEEKHSFRLEGITPNAPYNMANRTAAPATPKYHLCGAAMVFVYGHMVYHFNPLNRELKTFNLLGTWEPLASGYSQGSVQVVMLPNNRQQLSMSAQTLELVGTLGPVSPRGICMTVKERGMVLVDPETGRERWIRSDIPTSMEIFGDPEYVFLHQTGKQGARYAAHRLADASLVPVADFTPLLERKIAVSGRHILVQDSGPADQFILRCIDPLDGSDTWHRTFGPLTALMTSEDQEFVGVVELAGHVRIHRVDTGAQVLKARLPAQEFVKEPQVRLLADREHWYVVLAFPERREDDLPGVAAQGPIRRNAASFTPTLRVMPVNGPVYCFDRKTGEQRWRQVFPPQALILEQFDDLPILLCGTVQMLVSPVGGYQKQLNAVFAIDKQTGAAIDLGEAREFESGQTFQMLRLDALGGRVELFTHMQKIVFQYGADSQAPSH
jgi:outer membrane protein assembly factor BamB/tetratricopeptide (TPR) repeat protein